MRYLLFTGVVAVAFASCISHKNFTVHSNPSGASVTINGEAIPGTTPVTTEIKQRRDLGIVVRKDGYQTTSTTVRTKPHWFFSLLWTQTDPRARYIPDDEVTVNLVPVPGATSYVPTAIPKFDGKSLPPYPNGKQRGGSDFSAPALRPMPSEF